MKNKGFTLIELLAVIVILAVIALILTPIVSDIIASSKLSANKRSAENYIRAAEHYYASLTVNEENAYNSNIIDKLELKGKKASSGEVKINEQGEVLIALIFDNKCYTKSYSQNIANIEVSDNIENCGSEPTIAIGTEWNFDYYEKLFNYTGEIQTFKVPKTGTYKLEVWGAQGGDVSNYTGGYGGYAKGNITLNEDDILYIVVGSKPSGNPGGYNGGGDGSNNNYGTGAGGGGATHIATVSGELKQLSSDQDKIIMVAAGGGGATLENGGRNYDVGGHGGGLEGTVSTASTTQYDRPTVGTQTSAGTSTCANGSAGFGYGGNSCPWAGGGGAGYYGGGGGNGAAGAGGSGYIGYINLSDKKMVCYNCTEDKENEATYTETTTCVNEQPTSLCAKKGNGYARITYIPETGNVQIQSFTAPKSGTYKLEVWGAEGGSYNTNTGGYGGYSKGEIVLDKNQEIYIVIGGKGITSSSQNGVTTPGGFNGGGSNTTNQWGIGSTGGGATHIATSIEGDGQLKNYDSAREKVIIVAGGGGGGGSQHDKLSYVSGGSGGGFIGGSSKATDTDQNRINQGKYYRDVQGGSQDIGYAFGQGQSAESWSGSGGGGWYGGYYFNNYGIGGSGGSGYIASTLLSNKKMVCYNCTEDKENQDTYTEITTCVEMDAQSECAKKGDGYAKITLVR